MFCWFWMLGYYNFVDWLICGCIFEEFDQEFYWWNGLFILYKFVEEWGFKFNLQNEGLFFGEKKICSIVVVIVDLLLVDFERFSDIN